VLLSRYHASSPIGYCPSVGTPWPVRIGVEEEHDHVVAALCRDRHRQALEGINLPVRAGGNEPGEGSRRARPLFESVVVSGGTWMTIRPPPRRRPPPDRRPRSDYTVVKVEVNTVGRDASGAMDLIRSAAVLHVLALPAPGA